MNSKDEDILQKFSDASELIQYIQNLISNEKKFHEKENNYRRSFKGNLFDTTDPSIYEGVPEPIKILAESNNGNFPGVWKKLSEKLDYTLEEIFSDVSKLVKKEVELNEVEKEKSDNVASMAQTRDSPLSIDFESVSVEKNQPHEVNECAVNTDNIGQQNVEYEESLSRECDDENITHEQPKKVIGTKINMIDNFIEPLYCSEANDVIEPLKNTSCSLSPAYNQISTIIEEMLSEDDEHKETITETMDNDDSPAKREKENVDEIKSTIVRKSSRTPKRRRIDYSPDNNATKRRSSLGTQKELESKHQCASNNKSPKMNSKQSTEANVCKSNKKLKCDYPECSFSSYYEYNITYHNKKKHGGIKWSFESKPEELEVDSDMEETDDENGDLSYIDECRIFRCTTCKFITISNEVFKHHLKKHDKNNSESITPDADFKCSECDFKTSREANLLIHKTLRHSEAIFVSSSFNPTNVTESDQSNNVVEGDDSFYTFYSGLYKCKECSYSTQKVSSLKRHYVVHRKMTTKKLKSVTTITEETNKPLFKYRTSPDKSGHISTHMTELDNRGTEKNADCFYSFDSGIYKCKECNYTNQKLAHMKSHYAFHRKKFSFKTKAKFNTTFKSGSCKSVRNCKSFSFTSSYLSNLITMGWFKKHMANEELDLLRKEMRKLVVLNKPDSEDAPAYSLKKYACPKCDYSSDLKGNVAQHLLSKRFSNSHFNSKTEFKVAEDQSMGSQVNSDFKRLREEMRKLIVINKPNSLNKFKIYKCPKCRYSSKFKGNVTKHLMLKRFCNSHFKSSMDLLEKFETNKRYGCSKCNYSSNRRTNVRIHITKIHMKEFYLLCDIQDGVKIKKASGNKAKRGMKCPKCEFRTSTKLNIRKHFMTVHMDMASLVIDKASTQHNCSVDEKATSCVTQSMNNRPSDKRKNVKSTKKPDSIREKSESQIFINIIKDNSKKCFICSKCNYSNTKLLNIKVHFIFKHLKDSLKEGKTLNESKSGKFMCPKCDYSSTVKGSVKIHMASHAKVFLNEKDTGKHMARQAKVSVCKKGTRLLKNNVHKFSDKNSTKIFLCPKCEFLSRFKASVKTHLIHIHAFSRNKITKNTIREAELGEETPSKKLSTFKCLKDDHVSYFKENVENHEFQHYKNGEVLKYPKFDCSQCSYSSEVRSDVGHHLQTKHVGSDISEVHESEVLKCVHCNCTLKFRSKANTHKCVIKVPESHSKSVYSLNKRKEDLTSSKGTRKRLSKSDSLRDNSFKREGSSSLSSESESSPKAACSDSMDSKSKLSPTLSASFEVSNTEAESSHKSYSETLNSNSVTELPSDPYLERLDNKGGSSPVSCQEYMDFAPTPLQKPISSKTLDLEPGKSSTEELYSENKQSKPKSSSQILAKENISQKRPSKLPSTRKLTIKRRKFPVAKDGYYHCNLCKYKTLSLSMFMRHNLLHLKVKKLHCTQCPYATNLSKNLKHHQLCHLLIKKLKCSDCKFSTNFNANLKRHVQKCHQTSGQTRQVAEGRS